jgi:hypothetical protein
MERLTPEEFVTQAIVTLRTGEYKGIHARFSGFNDAFRQYFPNQDPIEVTRALAEAGKIVIRPARGGVVLYLPGDAPNGVASSGHAALKKILSK